MDKIDTSNADVKLEHGTHSQKLKLQIVFVSLLLAIFVIGFLAQYLCWYGDNVWFARSGAVVVGLVLGAGALDREFGCFSGITATNLANSFAKYTSKQRFTYIETTFVVTVTLVWGFGDLFTISCWGN